MGLVTRRGFIRNSTPRPDTAWPCFSLEISALPHPAEWPSATSSSLRCPGRLRPPPGPGQDPTLRPESGSACRDSSPPPPPGSPTQAGPQPRPLLYCSLLPVLQATPALLPLAVSRWLAQSPGRGRVLLPTAQGETEAQRRLDSLGSRPRPPDLPHHTLLPCEVPGL